MSASCCDQAIDPHRGNESYRRVLWVVLAINAVMFAVEVAAGLAAGSASLQADALDFLGDAGNYAISLFVVGMALRYRAMAAFLKGATMGVFGLWVLGVTAWHVWHGTLPHAFTMGAVGIAALIANAASFGLLWAYRGGDANMRSAWICTRNDVLRQSCGASCSPRSVWNGHRLARRNRSHHHGRTCPARGVDCSPPVTVRAANFEFASITNARSHGDADVRYGSLADT